VERRLGDHSGVNHAVAGDAPTRSRRTRALAYRLAGGALLGFAALLGSPYGWNFQMLPHAGTSHEWLDSALKAAIVHGGRFGLAALLGARGVSLYNRGRRLTTPPAHQVLSAAKGPPILYLRSFAADAIAAKTVL